MPFPALGGGTPPCLAGRRCGSIACCGMATLLPCAFFPSCATLVESAQKVALNSQYSGSQTMGPMKINLCERVLFPEKRPVDSMRPFEGFVCLCCKTSEAVSYTHLDVYKRQAFNRSISWSAVRNFFPLLVFWCASLLRASLCLPMVSFRPAFFVIAICPLWPWCRAWVRSAPVSYTHLDVYKRQVVDKAWFSVVLAVLSALMGVPALLRTCLLYTARCV